MHITHARVSHQKISTRPVAAATALPIKRHPASVRSLNMRSSSAHPNLRNRSQATSAQTFENSTSRTRFACRNPTESLALHPFIGGRQVRGPTHREQNAPPNCEMAFRK